MWGYTVISLEYTIMYAVYLVHAGERLSRVLANGKMERKNNTEGLILCILKMYLQYKKGCITFYKNMYKFNNNRQIFAKKKTHFYPF